MSIPDEVLKETIREWLPTITTWVCAIFPFAMGGHSARIWTRFERKWEKREPSLKIRLKYALQGFGLGAVAGVVLWTLTVGMHGKWPQPFVEADVRIQTWFDAANSTTVGWWMIKVTELIFTSSVLLNFGRGLKSLIQCLACQPKIVGIKVGR
jgi:hypothetical protein